MSVLQIFLFGKFHRQCGEQVLVGLDARKVQELFCYLLLHWDRPHPRESLADLLWGDSSTTQSKKYLRQTLWQLQAALDSQIGFGNDRVLRVEPDCVQLNSDAGLWLDVAAFEQAFIPVQSMPSEEIDYHGMQTLLKAVGLYKGDLLEGWYQDWCLYERERLQNMYLAMLDKLMAYFEAHHEYETGLVYGRGTYPALRPRTHPPAANAPLLTSRRLHDGAAAI